MKPVKTPENILNFLSRNQDIVVILAISLLGACLKSYIQNKPIEQTPTPITIPAIPTNTVVSQYVPITCERKDYDNAIVTDLRMRFCNAITSPDGIVLKETYAVSNDSHEEKGLYIKESTFELMTEDIEGNLTNTGIKLEIMVRTYNEGLGSTVYFMVDDISNIPEDQMSTYIYEIQQAVFLATDPKQVPTYSEKMIDGDARKILNFKGGWGHINVTF